MKPALAMLLIIIVGFLFYLFAHKAAPAPTVPTYKVEKYPPTIPMPPEKEFEPCNTGSCG